MDKMIDTYTIQEIVDMAKCPIDKKKKLIFVEQHEKELNNFVDEDMKTVLTLREVEIKELKKELNKFRKGAKCSKCGKPDEYSDEVICYECMKRLIENKTLRENQKLKDTIQNACSKCEETWIIEKRKLKKELEEVRKEGIKTTEVLNKSWKENQKLIKAGSETAKENYNLKKELEKSKWVVFKRENNETIRFSKDSLIELYKDSMKEIKQLKKEIEELRRLNKKYKPYFDRLRKGV